MDKTVINTPDAPAPIGPYNQAILAGNTLFISGQVCIDPATGQLKNRDLQEETHQVIATSASLAHTRQFNYRPGQVRIIVKHTQKCR